MRNTFDGAERELIESFRRGCLSLAVEAPQIDIKVGGTLRGAPRTGLSPRGPLGSLRIARDQLVLTLSGSDAQLQAVGAAREYVFPRASIERLVETRVLGRIRIEHTVPGYPDYVALSPLWRSQSALPDALSDFGYSVLDELGWSRTLRRLVMWLSVAGWLSLIPFTVVGAVGAAFAFTFLMPIVAFIVLRLS